MFHYILLRYFLIFYPFILKLILNNGDFLARIQKKHIINILITLILSLSLFLFGLYIISSQQKWREEYIRNEIVPTRIYSFILSLQNRYSGIFIAGEAISHTMPALEETIGIQQARKILGTVASYPLLEYAEGYDLFDADSGTLYNFDGHSIESISLQGRKAWVDNVLTKENSSKLDLLFLPDKELPFLYVRYPLHETNGKYRGFLGLRYPYAEVSEYVGTILKERQTFTVVNRNSQIIYNPTGTLDGIEERDTVFFLSRDNPRYYLGELNSLIGIEEETAMVCNQDTARYLTYYPLLNAYFIVEDTFTMSGATGMWENTIIPFLIGIALLCINIYTIFSYQRLVLKKNSRLSELIEEKNMFLSVMSHNVNNTISVLSNDLHNALREKKPLSFQRKMILLSWMDTTKRLISNIIFYLRHDEGEGTESKDSIVDISELLRTTLLRNREKGELKEQDLVLELEEGVFTTRTNRNLLSEALDNLIDNAIKYSPMKTTITLRGKLHNRDTIAVTVADEGPGFTEKDREGLFQPFKRGSARPTGGEQSTGLGLYVAHMIILKLGGRLELKETGPKGSTFLLTLPVK